MKTYTIEFDVTEMVKLISICNAAIVVDETTLRHLPVDSKAKEMCNKSIATIENLKGKIKKTLLDNQ